MAGIVIHTMRETMLMPMERGNEEGGRAADSVVVEVDPGFSDLDTEDRDEEDQDERDDDAEGGVAHARAEQHSEQAYEDVGGDDSDAGEVSEFSGG